MVGELNFNWLPGVCVKNYLLLHKRVSEMKIWVGFVGRGDGFQGGNLVQVKFKLNRKASFLYSPDHK